MTSSKHVVEIRFEDPNPQKWRHPLKEDGFAALMNKENATVHKIFGAGSFFSPLLFGKFFDPADAFPLWEFEADALLCNPHSSNKHNIDWFQTDTDYVLIAQLLGIDMSNNNIQVCVENGKVIEISGHWKQQGEPREWRSSRWWEHGFVRRLELPDKTEWKKVEARVNINDNLLEIRVPKQIPPNSPQEI